MNKIHEVKKKLSEYRGKMATDALTVITEQESEIDRLNCEIEAMKAAFEEEQQKAAGVFCEKVKLTVENKNIKTDFKNLLEENKNLLEENSKLAEQVEKEKSKNDDLVIKLAELQRKASSFVLDPNEVEKVVFDRCPVCKNNFRLFVKRGERVNVTAISHKKYAKCPKCGETVNDYDNKTCCGHCGTLLEWGKQT